MRRIIPALLASLLVLCSLSARANEPELLPLVPDHAGLTINIHPSLCWILTGQPPQRATIMFTLNGTDHIEPIFEVQLSDPFLTEKNETCHCVNRRDYGIGLAPDSVYCWFISMRKNPESNSQDIVAGGMIERCDFEECMVNVDIPFGCDKRLVSTMATNGIWYEAISCLCDLIGSNPDDRSLRRMLHDLLGPVGLLKLKHDNLIPLKGTMGRE